MRPRHRPIVRALAEVFLSPEGEVSEERLDQLVDEMDQFVSPASKTLRFGLVSMLAVIQWSPILYGRFRLFTDLDLAARTAHLERLETSRIAQLALLVVAYKTIITMLFYEDERELRAIGYRGPERKRWLVRVKS